MNMQELLKSGQWEQGSPSGEPTETDLALINKGNQTPFKAEDVFVFACIMADNEIVQDSRAFRFGLSSLQTFAVDAAEGIPYFTQHDITHRKLGYTFAGHFDPVKQQALAGVFIPKGRVIDTPSGMKINSNQEIADINNTKP